MVIGEATKEEMPLIRALIRSERADGREISFAQFLVARNENEVIGCVRIKELKDYLELSSLVVGPQHRNKGVGSKLVKSILIKDKRRPIYLLCFAEYPRRFYGSLRRRK